MALSSTSITVGRLLFAAAVVLAAIGGWKTNRSMLGPDRLAAVGATLALAGAAVYGASEITFVESEQWEGLSFFVAPTSGLATVWWLGHTRFTDRARWVVSLIGAGWTFIAGLVFAIYAVQSRSTGPRGDGAPAILSYGLAGLLSLAGAFAVLSGAAITTRRAIRLARQRR